MNFLIISLDTTYVDAIINVHSNVMPDVYTIYVSIVVKDKKEKDVINTLGKIDRSIRNLNVDYVGGNYNLSKNCYYDENKQICEGFIGYSYYKFNLKEVENQVNILETFSSLKKEFKNMYFQIEGSEWILSKHLRDRIEDSLKISIIDRINNFSEQISKKINKKCILKTITYKQDYYFPYYKRKYGSFEEAEAFTAPSPKSEEITISVEANIKLACF
jgi:hypothetical protein